MFSYSLIGILGIGRENVPNTFKINNVIFNLDEELERVCRIVLLIDVMEYIT